MTTDTKKNNTRRVRIPVTGHVTRIAQILIASLIVFAAAAETFAQSNTVSHVNSFTSVEYYPTPHQQQMKSRLSGAEAQPLPGGLLAIKQLKLETFRPDGKPEFIVNAPECVYDQLNGTASSPGRLEVQTGNGNVRVEGRGFLWRQNDSFLIISNQPRTVIKTGPEKNRKS